MIEPLLLTTTQIATFAGASELSRATGFYFERDERLFLITSRHVLFDEPSKHTPDRIEITVHTDTANLTQSVQYSMLLYREGMSLWRSAKDTGGEIDVGALEIERDKLPEEAAICSFTPAHLQDSLEEVEVGASLRIVGFPLGFHDTLHRLPIVRQAAIASSFGVRFQGQGYFLTDARTHRGMSGAPVVMRDDAAGLSFPWKLLGVHSSRMEMSGRDVTLDEALSLNCAWYADVLMALTQEAEASPPDVVAQKPAAR
jgi:hypothetical protein